MFKSSGPDGVHPKLLKSLAYDEKFVEAVTKLFVKCSETGVLPDIWKTASVVALFKKGVKSDPLNYRPVSLTCILCKVYEKLVRAHLLTFLEERISKHQHGFMKGKSCLSNLLETFDNILDILAKVFLSIFCILILVRLLTQSPTLDFYLNWRGLGSREKFWML